MRWTPSFSSAATRRSDPLVRIFLASCCCGGIDLTPEIGQGLHFAGEFGDALFISHDGDSTIRHG